MEAVEHFSISTILALPTAYLLVRPVEAVPELLFLYLFGIICGTLIDLDHYVWILHNHSVKRFYRTVRDSVMNPWEIVSDNKTVIHDQDSKGLTSSQRYISHLLIAMIIPLLLVKPVLGVEYGLMSAVLFDIHIVSDVYADYLR